MKLLIIPTFYEEKNFMQNEIREQIQNKAEELSLIHKHLLLTWATGCGKGRAVMKVIAASKSDKKWLVICPEILQVENFKNDLEKHGFSYLLTTKIEEVICYASFKNYVGGSYNIALNECHRLSELRYNVAESIEFDQVISDSATVTADVRERLYKISPYFEYNIPLTTAIDIGLLPAPKFYIRKVSVTKEQSEQLRKLERTYKFWKAKYERERQGWQLNKLKKVRGESKTLLSEFKTEAVKKLISQLGDKRFICFTGSIQQCNDLGEEYAMHSHKTKTDNIKILNDFNEFKINRLIVNRMGREGLNLEEIEATIITQLDSGYDEGLSFLQATGRGDRKSIV